jgi:hypothetical protein
MEKRRKTGRRARKRQGEGGEGGWRDNGQKFF